MVGQTMEKAKDRRVKGGGAKRSDGKNLKRKFRGGRRIEEVEEIQALETRINAGAPAPGTNPLASTLPKDLLVGLGNGGGKAADVLLPYVGAKDFNQLPLSDRSKKGLKEAKYTHMTAIQRAALPHCLCGRDVLGAAKTGSGKTLAFVLPVYHYLTENYSCVTAYSGLF
jgi:ATP-dependent RNA helicase DDX10/DBP4